MKPTLATKPQKEKNIARKWHLVDVSKKTLGRSASEVATILQGKHKSTYTSHLDQGDFVVVINASQVQVTGRKDQNKIYTRYSGYPGGLKRETFSNLRTRRPQEVITHAVSGMLPKNKLRDKRLKRLFVYADEKHPHTDKFEVRNSKSESSSNNQN